MKTLLCQDIASKVEMGDMKSSMKNVKKTFENVFRVSTQPKKCIFNTDYLGCKVLVIKVANTILIFWNFVA